MLTSASQKSNRRFLHPLYLFSSLFYLPAGRQAKIRTKDKYQDKETKILTFVRILV